MKIGEARKIYSEQLHEYQAKKRELAKQKESLEKKCNGTPNGKELFAKEAATLELSYQAVSDKYEEYHSFMEKLSDMHTALFNAEAAKQQGEAMEEYGRDLGKLMEVARRIAKGAKVPGRDEQKLMEYSMEMYMAAKNAAMMNELKEKEEYDSLWEEEEDKTQNPDPWEVADEGEFPGAEPEIAEASEVAAAPSAGASPEQRVI